MKIYQVQVSFFPLIKDFSIHLAENLLLITYSAFSCITCNLAISFQFQMVQKGPFRRSEEHSQLKETSLTTLSNISRHQMSARAVIPPGTFLIYVKYKSTRMQSSSPSRISQVTLSNSTTKKNYIILDRIDSSYMPNHCQNLRNYHH